MACQAYTHLLKILCFISYIILVYEVIESFVFQGDKFM